jgi:hypothetical protein
MLCLSGADCWADAPCLDGVCIQTCENQDDCGAAGDCIDGRCIYCAVDGDCPDGEHCRSGQCYVSR